MAEFKGEFRDFEKFIGPRLRNIVQTSISKKYKKSFGKCEGKECENTTNLEAAHVHGKGRKELLKIAYDQNLLDNKIIDLKKFEESFINLHYPLEANFKILCKSCHKSYDKVSEKISVSKENSITKYSENTSEILEIILFPNDINEFKKLLLQYKRAYIKVFYCDGSFKTKEWNASKFTENSGVFVNLRSRHEFRQGNWQLNKIRKIEVGITSLSAVPPPRTLRHLAKKF